jgi:hypothetical protein
MTMSGYFVFVAIVSALLYMKSQLSPNITASTSLGCRGSSKICVESSSSTSGKSKTSIQIRLKK